MGAELTGGRDHVLIRVVEALRGGTGWVEGW